MSPIRRPPVLAVGHQFLQVCFHRFQVQFLKCFAIVESIVVRIGLGVVLVQDVQVQRLRPPVCHRMLGLRVRPVMEGAFSVLCFHFI